MKTRSRNAIGGVMTAAALAIAIPSVSAATPHAPGGGTKVLCTVSGTMSLAKNLTGKVTIKGNGKGSGGATCSIQIVGQWKKADVQPISIGASTTVTSGVLSHVTLTSPQFTGSFTGKLSTPAHGKVAMTVALLLTYPPLAQVVRVVFST